MKPLNLFFPFFLMAYFFTTVLFAGFEGEIKLNAPRTELRVVEQNAVTLRLENALASIQTYEVATPEGVFTRLTMSGYASNYRPGYPELPVLSRLIEIPHGAEAQVRVVSYQEETIDLAEWGIATPIFPSQPSISKSEDPAKVKFQYRAEVYRADEFSGQEIAALEIVGTMRGRRLARLSISPLRYNAAQNVLKALNYIEIEIRFANADLDLTRSLRQKYYSPLFEAAFERLLNYQLFIEDTLSRYPIKYVILADPMFQAVLQPFVEWKTRKGFNVMEAYKGAPGVGTTREQIKAYLKSLYDNATPQDPAPTYLLIVGDVDQIPAFISGHHTDLYYCEYDGGGDYLPELYYGRFSANQLSELTPQIDKTLEYEQYLMPDPSFLNEVVMIAGMDGFYGPLHANGQINYGTDYYFNAAHGLLSHTYLYPQSGSSGSQIIQNVSDGVGYANYTAHGGPSGWSDPSFEVSDIPSLQNAHQYPLMVGNACSTNEFQVYACFGEALLRAVNKGALGYIGGSNSTYWDEDFYWGVGVGAVSAHPTYQGTGLGSYDRMFHDHGEPEADWYVTQGQMIHAGNLAVTEGSPGSAQYYWEIYHLMGDPSLSVYFSVPDPLPVTHLSAMPVGTSALSVTTEPHAYVALSMNGVLLDAQLADATGIVNLGFDPIINVGSADIVVTRQNRAPYIETISVVPNNAAYVIYSSHSIDDGNGNNNGVVDFGETILLDMTLQNVGSVNAEGVSASLFSADEFIAVNDSLAEWGDIPANASAAVAGAFRFTAAANIPDQHSAIFRLKARDSFGAEWISYFTITANAPVLTIGNLTIDDGAGGNGNGKLDPGETVDIIIETANTGHSDCEDVLATLSCGSEYISLLAASFNLGSLAQGGAANAVFSLSVDPATPAATPVELLAGLAAGAYQTQHTFTETVGSIDEDFETGNFTHYNWIQGGNQPWQISSVAPYQGSYCAKSGPINHQQNSSLSLSVTVFSPGVISFYKKVSSEADYDFLEFYIDNIKQGEWSGAVDWSQETYPIGSGVHILKWVYAKDYSVVGGQDCAWIDNIVFPQMALAAKDAALLSIISPVSGSNLSSAEPVVVKLRNFGWEPISNFPVGFCIDGGITFTEVVDTTLNPGEVYIYVFTATANLAVPKIYQVMAMVSLSGDVITSNDTVFAMVENQIITGIDPLSALPKEYKLHHNFPNPFNPTTTIKYDLPADSRVTLKIYNILGQEVRTLANEHQAAGYKALQWDGKNQAGEPVSSGIYIYRISAGSLRESREFVQSYKMLLLK